MLDSLVESLVLTFSWPVFFFLLLGLLIGIFIGMIPGIGPAIGLTLALPFTVVIDEISAMVLLTGMYVGGVYGGSVSAILLNVPGTAASAASTFDGYPLSRQGRARDALAISAAASAIGGLFAIILVFLSTPIITELVLAFGTPEFVLIAFFGLAMITVVARGSLVKGITAGMIGMLLATIGLSPGATEVRYDFGSLALYDGLDLVTVILGLFAIAEMIRLSGETGGIAKNSEITGSVLGGLSEIRRHARSLPKFSLVGVLIGAIPGAGSSVANFVAYGEAVRSDSSDDTYGKGNPRGLIASEASNNSSVAGSLVPTLSFGIPGSIISAILLGALLMHGIQPGPSLFSSNLHITFSIYWVVVIGSVLVIPVIGLFVVTRIGAITKINTKYLIPGIVVLCMFGAYAIRSNWADLIVVLAVGILGILLVRYNYSIIALLLGMILGPIAENNLDRAMQLSDGSYWIFFDSTISKLMWVGIAIFVLTPVIKKYRNRT